MTCISRSAAIALLCLAAGLSTPLQAIAPHSDQAHPEAALPTYRATSTALDVNSSLILQAQRDFSLLGRVAPFLQQHGSEWEVRWDARGDRAAVVQGQGIALIPGRGNRLRSADLQLSGDMSTDLPRVAEKARAFIDSVPELLAADRLELKLDSERSTGFGVNNERWFLEFQQHHNGVPVDGAFMYVRIVHGNVVQFGAERVGDISLPVEQANLASSASLFTSTWEKLGFPDATRVTETLQDGELRIYPMLPSGQVLASEHSGMRGAGYDHVLARRYVFRVDEHATWQVLVDARSGEIIDLRDLTVHVDAQVSGGVYPTTNTDPQIGVNFPFTAVTNNGSKITDIDGVYDYSGGTATVTLDGQYFRMSDSCGAISLSNSTTGNLDLGTSGGTDCTTPGFGGAGNTHSSRTGFYHLTLINAKARSILPANSWLQTKVTANMNINNQCNATWNGTAVNFYRSGGGCSNTGEIAAVFLHEWGHGMDQNTGGSASENASGEAVGDTFAFLETRDACIGPNFIPGQNCHNCTSCTGVRDVSDFGLGGTRVIASPANITAAAGINCGRFACPYSTPSGFPYRGPMGYQGHCESLIASNANWDLKDSLVEEFGESGWQRMDNIWYGSLVPSKSAYQVASGGTCNTSATVNGCGATNWYTVFLAADDDDGNLANGTPNACRIWDAFDAHGIACGTRPACTEFSTPDFSLASAQADQQVCAGDAAQFVIDVGSQSSFMNPVTLAVSGTPAGATTAFTANPAIPGTSTGLDIGNTAAVAAGSYPLLVSGTATGSDGHDLALNLRVDTALDSAVTLQSPADGAVDLALSPVLVWQALAGAASYTAQIATDAGFSNIVAQQSGITGTTWQAPALLAASEYFWRVLAVNSCGSSSPSATFSFTTIEQFCRAVNLAIPDNSPTGVTDTMVVAKPGEIESLRLRIRADHTWVGDLSFRLTRNGGSFADVIDRPGVPASANGCSANHINVLLDDTAAGLVENACAGTPPALGGVLRPNNLMATAFAGQDFDGSWTLRAVDAAGADTGTLLEWCLEPTFLINEYSVGGQVSGLLGSGLALSLNGGEPLPVSVDGGFTFPTALADGSAYSVSVASQPNSPLQICEVTNASGKLAGADVTNVSVNCGTELFSVGGTVSGLIGDGLSVSLNGGAAFGINADGGFVLPDLLPDGENFLVEIVDQPTGPTQVCEVTNGSGQINGADVSSVSVDCVSPDYQVGGNVQGLLGSGLELTLNGAESLPIAAGGSFQFTTTLAEGQNYDVQVTAQPQQPSQTCSAKNATGTVGPSDVSDVQITCATDQFTVGGTVSGLLGSGLALSLNGGAGLALSTDGAFSFPEMLDDGSSYVVTVSSQPTDPAQVCEISQGTGNVGGAAVASVSVDCSTPDRTIGGQVSGLLGSGLTIALNGSAPMAVAGDGSFMFGSTLIEGESYLVEIVSQPSEPDQVCSVINANGNVGAADVTDLQVLCFLIGVFSDDFE